MVDGVARAAQADEVFGTLRAIGMLASRGMLRVGSSAGWIACAVACLTAGCGSPMIYPRTPDLHRDISVAVRTNVSESRARASFTARPGAVPESNGAPERSYEGYAGSSTDSLSSALRFAFAVFSTEASMAYGFSDSVAIGGVLPPDLPGARTRIAQEVRTNRNAPEQGSEASEVGAKRAPN